MESGKIAARAALAFLVAVGASGCASGPSSWKLPEWELPQWKVPDLTQLFTPPPPVPNPMPVPSEDFDLVWNRSVAQVNRHFPIASENRLAGTIRTESEMTGTLIEPWTGDAATFRDRLEATLQTIRRFAVVHVEPGPTGGYLVKVEVFKELEDLAKPASQPAGRAAYYNDFPVNRTRQVVGTVQTPLGFIPKGRDTALEQIILRQIREALLL